MESENLSNKEENNSEIGFFTQMDNQVRLHKNFETQEFDKHIKHMSEFNIDQGYPHSDYYKINTNTQFSENPKNTFVKKKKRNAKVIQNFHSLKKKAMYTPKSNHASLAKRGRNLTKGLNKTYSKKGTSLFKKKLMYEEDSRKKNNGRKYRKKRKTINYPPSMDKSRQQRSRQKKSLQKKPGRAKKKAITASYKNPSVNQSIMSKDRTYNRDVKSLQRLYNFKNKLSETGQKVVKGISYLDSSEISGTFEQSLDMGLNLWKDNFSSSREDLRQSLADKKSGKMDYFKAKLNEIQSKYISSASYYSNKKEMIFSNTKKLKVLNSFRENSRRKLSKPETPFDYTNAFKKRKKTESLMHTENLTTKDPKSKRLNVVSQDRPWADDEKIKELKLTMTPYKNLIVAKESYLAKSLNQMKRSLPSSHLFINSKENPEKPVLGESKKLNYQKAVKNIMQIINKENGKLNNSFEMIRSLYLKTEKYTSQEDVHDKFILPIQSIDIQDQVQKLYESISLEKSDPNLPTEENDISLNLNTINKIESYESRNSFKHELEITESETSSNRYNSRIKSNMHKKKISGNLMSKKTKVTPIKTFKMNKYVSRPFKRSLTRIRPQSMIAKKTKIADLMKRIANKLTKKSKKSKKKLNRSRSQKSQKKKSILLPKLNLKKLDKTKLKKMIRCRSMRNQIQLNNKINTNNEHSGRSLNSSRSSSSSSQESESSKSFRSKTSSSGTSVSSSAS